MLNDELWFATDNNKHVDKYIYRQFVCEPIVRFKLSTMWLKMRDRMSMFQWIPIGIYGYDYIHKLTCTRILDHGNEVIYLLMDKVWITSDMFGGVTFGKVHFRFENEYICQQFKNTLTAHHAITKDIHLNYKLKEFAKLLCDRQLNGNTETTEIARIAMDEFLPLLRKKKPSLARLTDWIVNMTPQLACEWATSLLNTFT